MRDDKRDDETWQTADFLSLTVPDDEDDDDAQEGASTSAQDEPDNNNETSDVSVSKREEEAIRPDDLPPWMERRVFLNQINPLVALHNEIVDFCALMEPQPEEVQVRDDVVDLFKELAYATFDKRQCKVEVFGSQATGLFLPTSDVDLVIQLKQQKETKAKADTEKNRKEREKKEMEEWSASDLATSPLHRLADALREAWRNDLSYLEVIENTRVPLVKFTHGPSNVSFDVCFNQETGPGAAKLMTTFIQAMPPLRPLTFVLKYFMEARGLNEPYTGGVGSFMLQLMIVSFLQHRERDSFNLRRPSLYNLGALLVEFFELYGLDFNYITTGFSVRHDGFYFPKGAADRKETFWQPGRPFSMAVENPLDPTMDVGTPSFRIQSIQRSFEIAFRILLAQVTEPRVPSVSILATILPPTVEMQQRAILKGARSSRGGTSKAPPNVAAGDSDMDTSSSSTGEAAPRRKRRRVN